MEERVQKIIAAAGIMSRRAAEQLILDGRVRVNGAVVTELGTKADPDRDHIKVDGKLINPAQPRVYVMLNKPVGYVTTMSDPEGRPVVSDLLQGVKARVYPVGRLDYNTEGLLLLTNDGDFAHLITHPSHELPKTYLVKIKGVLDDRVVENLEQGVFLTDGKTAPARVRKIRKEASNSWVEITIHEGRKRQVRRMIDHTGHSVIKLKRVRVGSLSLGDLPSGTYRHLTPDEVLSLRESAMRDIRFSAGSSQTPVPAVRQARKERTRQTGKGPDGEQEQKAFDSWASQTAQRRKRERAGRRSSSARTGPGRDVSLSKGESRQRSVDSGRKTVHRGPRQEGERGASGSSWGRKPGAGGRDAGRFKGSPRQEQERGSSGSSWGRKPGAGGRDAGRFKGAPKQDRERGGTGQFRDGQTRSGDRKTGSFNRGTGTSMERAGQRPAWGRSSGTGGRPRTGQGPRKPGTARGGKGRGRKG